MPRGTTFRTWGDYFIPGTSVLRNKFTEPGKPHGETDPDKLRTLEEAMAHSRLQELHENPIQGKLDYDHMKAIHGYVFQDVYEWAGQERVAPVGERMTKEGHAYYPAGEVLTEAAEAQYRRLAAKDYLRGLPQDKFVDELAEAWGELNVVHSFREGNTRTQFVFFSQLSEQAGYRIDTAQFAPGSPLRDEFVQARYESQDTGNNQRLAAVLGKAISPLAPKSSPARMGDSGVAEALLASFPKSAKAIGRPSSTSVANKANRLPTTRHGSRQGNDVRGRERD
ncbi:cell filamentation protein [Microbacterium marinum]|uniref:protein adenylyltransferase n=1 Tax=Microbacterium marinum TaxID=421115 RepID=A0A7W7FKQ8_9MICO|nr:Fic family protein [Microbacterium marinum]MBB4666609.1 cell filamentation protein [Microbacterium marinum]